MQRWQQFPLSSRLYILNPMENSGSNAYTYPYKLERRPNKSNCHKIEKNMFYASKTHGVSYFQTETQLHTDCRTFNQILYIIHILAASDIRTLYCTECTMIYVQKTHMIFIKCPYARRSDNENKKTWMACISRVCNQATKQRSNAMQCNAMVYVFEHRWRSTVVAVCILYAGHLYAFSV